MKKAIVFLLICLSSLSFAENENIRRQTNMALSISEMGSLDWVQQINASSANWTRPDSIKVTNICIQDSGTVFVSTPNCDSVPLYSSGVQTFMCYPILINKIFRTSLKVVIFGRKNK